MNRKRFSQNDMTRAWAGLISLISAILTIVSAKYQSPIEVGGDKYYLWALFGAIVVIGIAVVLWPTLQKITGYDTLREAFNDLMPGRRPEAHPSEPPQPSTPMPPWDEKPARKPKKKKRKKKAPPPPPPKPKPKKASGKKAQKLSEAAGDVSTPATAKTPEAAPGMPTVGG